MQQFKFITHFYFYYLQVFISVDFVENSAESPHSHSIANIEPVEIQVETQDSVNVQQDEEKLDDKSFGSDEDYTAYSLRYSYEEAIVRPLLDLRES